VRKAFYDELAKLLGTGASSGRGECDDSEELSGLVDLGSSVFLFTVFRYLIE
jgi:hypothetical protein